MTKEELAMKRGIKLPKKKETPAEALIKNTSDEKSYTKTEEKGAPKNSSTKKNASAATKKTTNSKNTTPKKNVKSDTSDPQNKTSNKTPESSPQVKTASRDLTPETSISNAPTSPDNTKRGVGKPKKRKPGDKKLSLWIDEALVARMYNNLSYGDSAGELLNKALLEYLDNHNLQ